MSAVLPALARLQLTRERLRQSMVNSSTPLEGFDRPDSGRSTIHSLIGDLQSIPFAGVVVDVVSRWWEHHPLHFAGAVAVDTADAMVKSTAQRHPLGLVLGAFVFGGLLGVGRPWRWLLKPALLAAVLPQLVKKLVIRVPPQGWVGIWSALRPHRRHRPKQTMPFTASGSREMPRPRP